NNRDLGDDTRPADFDLDAPPPATSLTERLAADVPRARVVKAFSTVPHKVIELGRDRLLPHRISIFVCADDAEAKAEVARLAEDAGFAPVDSGGLARARLVDAVADFLRFHIGAMGLGLYATLSVHVLPAEVRR